jgi:hypothetical protein
LIQFEERKNGNWGVLGQFPVGLEINEPPDSHAPTLLTTGVTRIDTNVVELEIGNVTYQVVTLEPIP